MEQLVLVVEEVPDVDMAVVVVLPKFRLVSRLVSVKVSNYV